MGEDWRKVVFKVQAAPGRATATRFTTSSLRRQGPKYRVPVMHGKLAPRLRGGDGSA